MKKLLLSTAIMLAFITCGNAENILITNKNIPKKWIEGWKIGGANMTKSSLPFDLPPPNTTIQEFFVSSSYSGVFPSSPHLFKNTCDDTTLNISTGSNLHLTLSLKQEGGHDVLHCEVVNLRDSKKK